MSSRRICFCHSLKLGKVLVRPALSDPFITLSEHIGIPGAWAFNYCLYFTKKREKEIALREVVSLVQDPRDNHKCSLQLCVSVPSLGTFPR